MMAALEAARDALLECATLVESMADEPPRGSCKIGIEANISPADYPLIRVVPVRATPGKGYNQRTVETLIYFGVPLANSEGLEDVYEALFDLEDEILEVLKTLQGNYVETVTDEDRLDTYKLMAIRCRLNSTNTAPPPPPPI
jgi:hypothetical protein